MSIPEIILGVVLIVLALAVTMVVLFQEGQQKSLGAITGSGGDTFLSKNKARTIDTFLAKWTRAISIGFFLAVIAANIIMFFHIFGS